MSKPVELSPAVQAAVEANAPFHEIALAEYREKQRFKFKQIGEGEIELTALAAPIMSLEMMLESLVLVTAEKTLVAFLDKPTISMGIGSMGTLLTRNKTEIKKGEKTVEVPTFNLWLEHERRRNVYTLTFDPRAGEFCYSPDQRLALNLWRRRPHTPPANADVLAKPFLDHVAYLVPEVEERERFLDWLAHIEQKPGELPHAHYLMTATQQGVGRNWLSSLLACVWTGHVALDFDLAQYLKSGFNGHLSRKLLANVDEINEGGKSERWEHSEKLKSMVTTRERFINIKYGLQYSEINCCRWLLFSNYESALPLHEGDRRWNVIRNPSTPQDADYYARLYKALDDTTFIAAVRDNLMRRDITKFNPGARAVMNEAKESVIANSGSPDDERARELVKTYPRDLILADHLYQFIFDEAPDGFNKSEIGRNWRRLVPIAAQAGIEKLHRAKDMTMWGRRGWKVWILRKPHVWRQAPAHDVERELGR